MYARMRSAARTRFTATPAVHRRSRDADRDHGPGDRGRIPHGRRRRHRRRSRSLGSHRLRYLLEHLRESHDRRRQCRGRPRRDDVLAADGKPFVGNDLLRAGFRDQQRRHRLRGAGQLHDQGGVAGDDRRRRFQTVLPRQFRPRLRRQTAGQRSRGGDRDQLLGPRHHVAEGDRTFHQPAVAARQRQSAVGRRSQPEPQAHPAGTDPHRLRNADGQRPCRCSSRCSATASRRTSWAR